MYPQLNQLKKGEHTVSVEARSLDVLRCLARHAPQVVSREQILEEVWAEAFIGEEVISHAVWELRKVFGDDARNSRYIQTVPRKGYRLVAEIVRPSGAAEPREGVRIGQYEIGEELGIGAMGVVYKAFDRRLRRLVALKFLASELTRDETARYRFQREARLAASLDHPNLATVHEIGETAEGRQYIVTPFYGGGSLKQRLESSRLDVEEAVAIAAQIASGLSAAHDAGIIHRDVKPANILLTESGQAKLVDFGIAKLANGTRLTQTGSSLGTPAYKSPEQSRGETVDHRADIWSLGAVLYEMLCGRRRFGGDYEHAIVRAILEDEPESLTADGVPEEFDRVVHKALVKDPEHRYQKAEELAADLERQAGAAPGAPIAPPAKGFRRPFAAGMIVLVLAAGGYLASRFVARPPTSPNQVSAEVSHLLSQGLHFEREGDTSEELANAVACYRGALELDPENPETQARLAMVLTRQQVQFPEPGQLEEIRTLALGACDAAPDLWLGWFAVAKLRMLKKDYEKAAEAARNAIELTPKEDAESDRGHSILGEALIELGRTEEGLRESERAVKSGDGFVRARLVLAGKLWDLGRLDQAAGEYDRVLRYDPNHMEALNNLTLLYYPMGRYRDALPLIKRAPGRRDDPRIANNIGSSSTCV